MIYLRATSYINIGNSTSKERRGELDEQLALYVGELFLGDPESTCDAFVAWCDTLSDDEKSYSYMAFTTYVKSLVSEM